MQDWRVTTWNLQGSHGLDRSFVAEHISGARPDVLVVQEILRRQARLLADDLAMRHVWARKHTPLPGRSEGLAILTPHVIGSSGSGVLTSAPPWSWRRRIHLRAEIRRGSDRLHVLNVHLSPHDASEQRVREVARIEAMVDRSVGRLAIDLIAGDFNDDPSVVAAAIDRRLNPLDIGMGGPPTSMAPGPRTGRRPSFRADGAIAVGRLFGGRSSTPVTDLDRWAAVSDHLPVTIDATCGPDPSATT